MEISTFELLLGPQIPVDLAPGLESIVRTTLQGYFLSISNLSTEKVEIELEFVALSPGLPLKKTLAFFDIVGQNIPPLDLNKNGKKVTVELELDAHDTGLFILQPDPKFLCLDDLTKTVYEARGYANIHLKSSSSADLLLTPEQRGTVFKNPAFPDPQLSQIIYSLPTATGGALYSLDPKNGEGGKDGEDGERG